MLTFADFINELDAAPTSSGFLGRVGDILCRDEPWAMLLAKFLRDSHDASLAALAIDGFVGNVSPRPFVIWKAPRSAFEVVLNYFDPAESARLLSEGFLKAHNHHRPFVSRVLSGSYLNFLYSNAGTRTRPNLKLARRDRIVSGNVCEMPSDVFHSVIAPEAQTLSVAVRGPAVFSMRHTKISSYDAGAALRDRDNILTVLDGVQQSGGVGIRVPYAVIEPAQ